MPGVDLYFVHGTWTDGEGFSDESSEFFKVLSKTLGEDLQVHRFPWSGGNSVTAREAASIDFAKAIQSRAEVEPDRVRIVLCHSHGGSVVMGALARAPAKMPFDALITIGTPYIYVNRFTSVEPGVPSPLGLWTVVFLIALACGFTAPATSGHFATAARMVWDLIVAHPLVILGCLLLLYSLVGGFAWLYTIATGGNLEWQKRKIVFPKDDAVEILRRRCLLPRAEVVPTLLIKVPGDEAHGALASAQFLSWTLHKLYAVPVRSVRLLREQAEDRYDVLEFSDREPWARRERMYLYIGCILPLWLVELALRMILSPPVVIFAAILSAPYGRDFLRLAGAVVLAVGDTPPGDWRIVYVPPFDEREFRREHQDLFANAEVDYVWDEFDDLEADLRRRLENATRGTPHSRAYGDPRVATLIAEWLAVRVLSMSVDRPQEVRNASAPMR